MSVYIALLRGVNVSGHKMMKMDALREAMTQAGCDSVQTYIQSGNAVFRYAQDLNACRFSVGQDGSAQGDDAVPETALRSLRERITTAIEARFGFTVPIALRRLRDLEAVLAECPYPVGELQTGEALYVALLVDDPPAKRVANLLALAHASRSQTDSFHVVDRTLYIRYQQSVHQSRLTNAWFERQAGVAATTRNWRTLSQLYEMAQKL